MISEMSVLGLFFQLFQNFQHFRVGGASESAFGSGFCEFPFAYTIGEARAGPDRQFIF